MIDVAVNYILAESHSDPLTTLLQISKNGTRQFLTCNPQFLKKKQKLFAVECKKTHNKDDFKEYFE